MGLFDLFKGKDGGKPAARTRKVLIVDDEPTIAEGLSIFLGSKGFEVELASDGKKGIETARRSPPDLILMDLTMPELNGLQVCAMLKQDPKTQLIPVLVLTAMPMDVENLEKAFKSGTDAYMTKPYDNDQLLDKIEKLLSGTNASQQLKGSKTAR